MLWIIGLLGIELLLANWLRRLLGWLLLGLLILLLVNAATVARDQTIGRRTPPARAYAADSNVFMDLWPACRQRIDARYLDDPSVTLYVHVAVYSEALAANDRYGSQTPRLSRLQQPGARRVPMATPLPANAAAMRSAAFDDVDMSVLETALALHVPLLTTNAKGIGDQLRSHDARKARYATVRIIDPCAGLQRPR